MLLTAAENKNPSKTSPKIPVSQARNPQMGVRACVCSYRCWVDPIGAPDKSGWFAQMWIRPDRDAPQPQQLRRFSAFFSLHKRGGRAQKPLSWQLFTHGGAVTSCVNSRWSDAIGEYLPSVCCRLLPSKNNLQPRLVCALPPLRPVASVISTGVFSAHLTDVFILQLLNTLITFSKIILDD